MTTASPQSLELAESALQEAVRNGDVEALDGLLHPSVVFVGPDGVEVDKNADIAAHRNGVLILSEVRELSRSSSQFDSAGYTRVRLHLVGTSNGNPIDADFAYTRTWRFDGNRWQVVQAQGVAVPPRSGG